MSYDFTLAKHLTRDLRNYHNGALAQIKEQPESPENAKLLELFDAMDDELEALETFVKTESAAAALAAAKEKLAAAQAEFDAAKG